MGLPPLAVYGALAVLAALENIVPPVPADTAVAVGAFLTRGHSVSVVGVYAVTLLANSGSVALTYGLARTAGRGFVQGPIGRRLVTPAALQRIERLYHEHGLWGIFLSRFIPGVRAVVPPFAGIAGLSPARALLPSVAASALWYGALVLIAAAVIHRVEDVQALVGGAGWWGLGLAAVLGLAAIVLVRARRR